MNRLSCNEMTTYRWTFEEDVANYQALKLGGIGVWRQKLSDFGEERGIELLADSGLHVSNLLWAGGFTGSDGRSFRDSVEDALEAIRLAAVLWADCLVLYTGRQGWAYAQPRSAAIARCLGRAIAGRQRGGSHLGHRTGARFVCRRLDIFDRSRSAAGLIAEYDHPALKLVLDTYQVGGEPDLVDRLADLVPQIAVVHLADGHSCYGVEQDRCRLGDGQIPLVKIVQALEAAGYAGMYDVELVGPDIETCDYVDLIGHSTCAFESMYNAVRVA